MTTPDPVAPLLTRRKLQLLAEHCRHHTVDRTRHLCDLGIDIRAHVGGPDFGWGLRMPCSGGLMAKARGLEHEIVKCDRMERPTAEEVARDRASIFESERT